MCKVLKVSRSSYYKWLVGVPSKRALYNQMLSDEIKRIYTLYKGRYGSPRIAKELESLELKNIPLDLSMFLCFVGVIFL